MNLLTISVLMAVISACSDNSAAVKQTSDNLSIEKQQAVTDDQHDDITGEWDLIMVAPDDNGNDKLDEGERKNAITKDSPGKSFPDGYMKLNKDGSCVFFSVKMKGRWELETNQSSGYKSLRWVDEGDGKHRVGRLLSVTKEELILREPGGSSFLVYKRK